MKQLKKTDDKPTFEKKSTQNKDFATKKRNKKEKHLKRIDGKLNTIKSSSNSTPIGIKDDDEHEAKPKDVVLSLAKFERKIKRKAEKRKINEENIVDEPENVEKVVKKQKPKSAKVAKIAKVSTYSRCSREEFLKFWTDYTSKTLTPIEKEKYVFKSDFISATNDANEDANSFLTENIPEWQSCLEKHIKPASPLILFICGSALRSANLNRDLNAFKTGKCRVAKLFAKHMKVKEQASFLAKHAVHAGLGTPQRIKTLIDDDSLKLSNLRWIVIDWGFMDVKKKRLIDFDDIRKDFFDLIKKHLVPLGQENRLRFILI